MAVIIRAYRGDGINQGDDISNPIISTQAMSEARGKRFLDDPAEGGYYSTREFTIKIPHKSFLSKGDSITFSAGKLDLSEVIAKVKSYALSGTNKVMWGTVVAEISE